MKDLPVYAIGWLGGWSVDAFRLPDGHQWVNVLVGFACFVIAKGILKRINKQIEDEQVFKEQPTEA